LLNRLATFRFSEKNIIDYSFRPLDIRKAYYQIGFTSRSAGKVFQHFIEHKNMCIVSSKQCTTGYRHILVSKNVVDLNLTGSAGRFGSGYAFPLYLYPETT